ncbi:DUF1385 domain-containing protein [Candidatus Woesearchaeota archaeon]|nr:DUF1385 domain-containing protein [Candidatus Woesearchaeota archaeon]
MQEKPLIGGQAVIEGVMMRSPGYYATAVRNDKGKIVTQLKKAWIKPSLTKIPFLRGVINLFEMLIIGIKSLTWAANQFEDDSEDLTTTQLVLTLTFSFTLALGFFVALPYLLSVLTGVNEEASPFLFNLIDGVIKAVILVLYLYLISFMKDIKRVFQYHGAEHKTVYCYENAKPLTVKNVQKFSTLHPRCGTSFILLVVMVSIFFFALIPPIILGLFPNFLNLHFIWRKAILFFLRILMLPVIAGFTYEMLRFSAKHTENPLMKMVSAPGLWLQRITTNKPSDKQVEVAITSMKLVLKKEKIKN